MASTRTGEVTLRGAFPANTEVKLFDRTSDSFTAAQAGTVVKSAKVSKDSTVKFSSLDEGGVYWAAAKIDGEWRTRAVTAKPPREPKPKGKPLASAAPGRDTSENVKIVTGARGTKSQDPPPTFGHKSIGQESKNPEQTPHPSQEDLRSVPQRSFTITGEAHPKPKGEFQPTVPQSEVPKNTKQRSSTEVGEATVIPQGEVGDSPAVEQGDVRGKQRSDTPEGAATPKPRRPSKKARKKDKKVQTNPSASRSSAKSEPSAAEKATPTKKASR